MDRWHGAGGSGSYMFDKRTKVFLKPLQPGVAFLYPLKTSDNL